MKPLRNLLDRVEPAFHKGGKLEKLYPLYEAIDTFLYTPGEVTSGASHVRDGMDLKRMMITVVVALGPCIIMAMLNTGYPPDKRLYATQAIAFSAVAGLNRRTHYLNLHETFHNDHDSLSYLRLQRSRCRRAI